MRCCSGWLREVVSEGECMRGLTEGYKADDSRDGARLIRDSHYMKDPV